MAGVHQRLSRRIRLQIFGRDAAVDRYQENTRPRLRDELARINDKSTETHIKRS